MTDADKAGWSKKDTQDLLEVLEKQLGEALESEVPDTLSGEQLGRLRRHLQESLDRETVQGVRRSVRRFVDEEDRKQKKVKRREARVRERIGMVERLTLNVRVQHMILFSSTILLIITGLPIKFHESEISAFLIGLMGGPEVTSFLHRIGAIGLTAIGFYHLFYTAISELGRRDFGLLLPKPQDVKDFFHQMGYFVGLKKTAPLYGRFSYIEKFDYWAVYWGMVVMITSGYLLWFKDVAINAGGKVVYDIAREAHSDEALLATLAIVIWHFYNVHFNPKRFPGSLTWWHGKIPIEEFKEEHPLEYEEWRAEGDLKELEEPAESAKGDSP